jgi:hypothetical protein
VGAQQARRFASSAYSGFLGDILSGKPYNDTQDPTSLAMKRCLYWATALNDTQAEIVADEIKWCEDFLRKELSRFPGAPDKQALMLDVLYRQAHWIGGTFELMDQVLDISTPFFSRPVLTASLSSAMPLGERRRGYEAKLTSLGHQGFKFGKGLPKGYATIDWLAETRHHANWLHALSSKIADHRWQQLATDAIGQAGNSLPVTLTILPCFGLPSTS